MSAITIDNDLVHYEVLGRGRPVILIHGWLGSWRYWIPAMQHLSLSNKYRIYALDLWGFGDSQKNSTRYGLTSQVALLQQFMEKLGIEKAAIVGHALGAAIAIEFAQKYPKSAPKIMLISVPLFSANAEALPEVPAGTPAKTSTGTLPVAAAATSTAPAIPSPTPVVGPLSAQSGGPTSAQPHPVVQPQISNQPASPSVSLATEETPSKPPSDTASEASVSNSHSSETLRRNPFLDNPDRLAQLRTAALAAGIPVTTSAPAKSTQSTPAPVVSQPNPLTDILTNVKPKALLERHLTRGDETLEKLRDEVEKTDETVLGENAKSFAGVNLAVTLSQLPMAVLLLHGQADPFLPSPDDDLLARIAAQKMAGAFLSLVVPDYRHFPMLEHTSQFNRLLVDFLDADLTNAQATIGLRETWRRQLR